MSNSVKPPTPKKEYLLPITPQPCPRDCPGRHSLLFPEPPMDVGGYLKYHWLCNVCGRMWWQGWP